MKLIKLINLFGWILLASCAQESPSVNKIDTSAASGIKQQGASSGGGGYSQQPTHQMLDIAKLSLADAVNNTPDEFFSKFPARYSKENIVKIIRDIKFMPKERRERDGSYLKMDYDSATDSLIATYDFYVVYNFPSLMSLASQPEQFREAINNIQTDIVHELSHLLGIGTSLGSNFTSELFSNEFLGSLKSVRYVCENEKNVMTFYPYKAAFFIGKKPDSEIFERFKNYEWYDVDLEETFETQERAIGFLENGGDFFQELESHQLWNYMTDASKEGSSFHWEEGIKLFTAASDERWSTYDDSGKFTEVNKINSFGFLFNVPKDSHTFISEINDTGHSSSSSQEPVGFGEYSKKLKSTLTFNEDFAAATFEYDLKVDFTEALTDLQLKHLEKAKKDRGEFNIKVEFSNCVKKVRPLAIDLFIKYPVSSPRDSENIKKLFDELRGW